MILDLNKINDEKYLLTLQKKYGKTYYFASLFFPSKIRKDVAMLYAFFRIPDEVVDNAKYFKIEPRKYLENWKIEWNNICQNKVSNYLILNKVGKIFNENKIPFEYGTSFINSMITDLDKKEYYNYEDLKSYMYGSASCVGLIMTHLFGFHKKETLYYSEQMGYAMQMTNFLRDIKEDYTQRERIYIPIEVYSKFNLKKEDFIKLEDNLNFKELIKDQIIFTKKLYKEAEIGIKDLKSGQLQTYLAGFLYSKILDKIEKQGFNVFAGRAKVSLLEKIYFTAKIIWKLKIKKEVPWQ